MRGEDALVEDRVRKINGSFAFIEHAFLSKGHLEHLCHHEMVLYLFLVLVSDRKGLSWYSAFRICQVLGLSCQEYEEARYALMEKDLIAFDGVIFQVLSLPEPRRDNRRAAPARGVEEENGELCDVRDIARIVDRVFSGKNRS